MIQIQTQIAVVTKVCDCYNLEIMYNAYMYYQLYYFQIYDNVFSSKNQA